MDNNQINQAKSGDEIDNCIQYTKAILNEQLDQIKSKKYDFAPEFKYMTIQLYLVGVMRQFYEKQQQLAPEIALEKAFETLHAMMIKDGAKTKLAEKQITFIKEMSKLKDGDEALAIHIGYESQPDDESLSEVFDHYVDEPRVSGALWRSYDRGKKIILLGGLLVGMVAVWFVTIFIPESSELAILATGLVAACLFILPTFLIGLLIYRSKIKQSKHS